VVGLGISEPSTAVYTWNLNETGFYFGKDPDFVTFPEIPENNGRSNYLTTNYQPQLVNSRRMVSQLPPAVPTGKGVLWGKNVVHLAAVTLVDPW